MGRRVIKEERVKIKYILITVRSCLGTIEVDDGVVMGKNGTKYMQHSCCVGSCCTITWALHLQQVGMERGLLTPK